MRLAMRMLVYLGVVPPPEVQEKTRQEVRDAVHHYRGQVTENVAASRVARNLSREAQKTAESAIRVLEEARDGAGGYGRQDH